MRLIIAYVPKDSTTVHSHRGIPIIVEDCMSEFPEGCGEDDEEGGWHDEAIFVHGKVMVDAMKEKVGGDADAIIGQVPSGA